MFPGVQRVHVLKPLRVSILFGIAVVSACNGDTSSSPGASGSDAGPSSDGGGTSGEAASNPGRLGPCGDITPATNHAPFEAIRRLATTRDEVRILVYGQSISQQTWWMQVRDWLKTTYPSGNLVMESHARGACSSECLVGREAWFTDGLTENRLPSDVYAWNPHLILFNVYGGDEDYEYIAKGFVQGCSAFKDHPIATAQCRADQTFPNYRPPEVLLQTDHRLPASYPLTPDADNLKMHNEVFIPDLAKRLNVSWADVWTKWGAYLDTHGRDPSAFLEDGLHLNDRGNVLMASLVEQDLCYKPLP